jgi:hypothetical protein
MLQYLTLHHCYYCALKAFQDTEALVNIPILVHYSIQTQFSFSLVPVPPLPCTSSPNTFLIILIHLLILVGC